MPYLYFLPVFIEILLHSLIYTFYTYTLHILPIKVLPQFYSLVNYFNAISVPYAQLFTLFYYVMAFGDINILQFSNV